MGTLMNCNCTNREAWLGAYVDGELAGDTHADALAHLGQCSGCRAELAALQQVDALLACDSAPAANPQLSVRFAQALTTHTRRRGVWQRLFGTAPARLAWGGALAIALGVGCMLYQPRHTALPRVSRVTSAPVCSSSPAPAPIVASRPLTPEVRQPRPMAAPLPTAAGRNTHRPAIASGIRRQPQPAHIRQTVPAADATATAVTALAETHAAEVIRGGSDAIGLVLDADSTTDESLEALVMDAWMEIE